MSGLARRQLWPVATAAFISGLLAFLPAKFLEARINEALAPPWHLAVSGTIWNGSGALLAGLAPDSSGIPLAWQFDPLALARLRIGWKVVANSPLLTGSARIGAGLRSLEFRDAVLTMDATALSQAIPVIALFAPSGKIFAGTPQDATLIMGYGDALRLNGDARIKADNLGLRLYGAQPLGNYQVNVMARDSSIDYAITQSSGALKLDGGGSIQTAAPRQIAYSGFITPSPALPENLLAQLKALGQPAADGRLRVDWKSRW